MLTHIMVRGAREHNLKGFDVALPRDSLIVITGLSGSGKSSLAFDTIYAEGQRDRSMARRLVHKRSVRRTMRSCLPRGRALSLGAEVELASIPAVRSR